MKKYNIKKILIITSIILLLLSAPIINSSINLEKTQSDIIKNNDAQINIVIYGSIRLFFSKSLYFAVRNIGETSAYNVSGSFKVTGVNDNSISFMDSFNFEEIPANHATGIWYTRPINGFGKITLSCNAFSSNAGDSSVTVDGLLIGFRAFVFGIYL